jgi:hypothetical protein
MCNFFEGNGREAPYLFFLFFSFSVNMGRDKVTYVQITRLVKPKIKKEGTITSNSLATLIEDRDTLLGFDAHPPKVFLGALHSTKEAALL